MKEALTFLLILGIAAAWHFIPTQERPQAGSTPHRMSPDNIFYLCEYISVATPRGVIGLSPGKQLELDTRAQSVSGKIVLTDGTNTVALDPSVLTHDMDEAIALRAQDQDNEANHLAALAQANNERGAQQRAVEIVTAQDIADADAQRSFGDAVGTYQSSLQNPARYQGSAGVSSYEFTVTHQRPDRHKAAVSGGDTSPLAASAANASEHPLSWVTPGRPVPPSSAARVLPMRPSITTGTQYQPGMPVR